MMNRYPDYAQLNELAVKINEYAGLKCEYGCAKEVGKLYQDLVEKMKTELAKIIALQNDIELQQKEPDEYQAIRSLCKGGEMDLSVDHLEDRMYGALIGRFAGCTLGVPVESWSIEAMQRLAKATGTPFPPTDYWHKATNEFDEQYGDSLRSRYTKGGMDGVPVDDDITYTLLGLLIMETYGINFTTANVGELWAKILPIACTAEEVALKNLAKGLPIEQVGEQDNPYCQWIGADIRSDPWGYACAGNPKLAAKLAYEDAYLSHRRNGIYGEMFFSAAIAAAFAVSNPLDAIRIALDYIPQNCTLHQDVEWALEEMDHIQDYRQAREAVDRRFTRMHAVHTNNNACLTIFGLKIGGTDFTKVLSEIVAMGMDNDCTAATAGSIVGAVVGFERIPPHWYEKFNNRVHSYLRGYPVFEIEDVLKRFLALQAKSQLL